jgi:membrane fusion protein, heavy metal efflux system
MNRTTILATLIAVSMVLGIGTAWTRFSPVAPAQAQDQGHDKHDHGSHGDSHDDHDDQKGDSKKAHADHDDHGNEGKGHDDHDEDGDDHGGHDGHGGHEGHEEGVVHLNEAQLSGLMLTPVAVTRGSLTTMVELPGEVSWNADRLVHISPRVSGIVSSVQKTLGDRVEVGDQLCVLESREMGNAKMEYLSDQSRFEVAHADYGRALIVYENTKKLLKILDPEPSPEEVLAKAHDLPVGDNKNRLLTTYTRMRVNFRNFKRNEKLLASKIASEAEFLQAQGEYEVSRADYLSTREEISFDLELQFLRAEKDHKVAETEMNNAERGLHILGLTNKQTKEIIEHGDEVDTDIARATLASPISGVIVDRHLTRGELVNTDTRLYTVADVSDVWVIGRAYERDIRFLKRGQKTTVRLDAFPGTFFEGKVAYVASQLDTNTRTVEVRVVMPNPQARIRAGMFATVVIHVSDEKDSAGQMGMIVPTAALQRVKGGFVVFQATGPGEYKMIQVQVQGKSREFAEITGEISTGAKVIVGDTFVLKSEVGKEEMGGGHSH